jgi:4-aminobutyrate aminotransferase-like enzyme
VEEVGIILNRQNDFFSLAKQYDADYNPSLLPIVIDRGEGALLIDTQGHRTIDLSNISANVGHCHPQHVNALRSAARQMIAGQGSITNPHRSRLFQKLVELTPPNLNKVFLSTSGSETCEWAIRIARRFTGRHEILSFWGGVYGRTYGATSMSGLMKRKRRFGPLMPGCLYAPYPYCYRCPFDKKLETCGFFCLHYLDQVINAEGTDDLAALIVEPYLGVGGIVFPPTGYLPRLADWADDRGVLFILDEVQSSFGRTGKMFALEREDLCPNMLCLGKGLGGGISIGALITEEDAIASLSPGELSGGSGGNALACASAMAVIDILEKEHLAEHAREVGNYLLTRFLEWQEKLDIIGDVRGQGLSLAIEFVKDRESKEPFAGMASEVSRACYAKGVFLSGGNHILSIRPPLVITQEQATKSADVIEETLCSLAGNFP